MSPSSKLVKSEEGHRNLQSISGGEKHRTQSGLVTGLWRGWGVVSGDWTPPLLDFPPPSRKTVSEWYCTAPSWGCRIMCWESQYMWGSECSVGPPQGTLVVKNVLGNRGDARDTHSTPGCRRAPGGGCGSPLQYSCLENPHGPRSLVGYSPQESDTTKWLSVRAHKHTHTHLLTST